MAEKTTEVDSDLNRKKREFEDRLRRLRPMLTADFLGILDFALSIYVRGEVPSRYKPASFVRWCRDIARADWLDEAEHVDTGRSG